LIEFHLICSLQREQRSSVKFQLYQFVLHELDGVMAQSFLDSSTESAPQRSANSRSKAASSGSFQSSHEVKLCYSTRQGRRASTTRPCSASPKLPGNAYDTVQSVLITCCELLLFQ
jgi:hypothetical protein